MTTRGFKEGEARQVGHLIADLLDRPNDAGTLAEVRAKVGTLARDFPVYG
jgi:glycine hydroxymethyltransferase